MLVRALNHNSWRLRGLAIAGLLFVPLVPLAAQAPEDDSGEPDRGVARISLINGDVSVRRGDSGDWVAAAPNAPLVVEDRILTGARSRAEVQFDYANFVRLAPDTEVRMAELEYRRYLLQVASGTVMFRVLRDSDADAEISTPSVSLRPVKRGSYRVTVLPDGTTEITVRSGEVEIFTTRGSERLKSGRTMMVRGTATDPEFQVVSALDKDEWDRWNEGRDRDLERSKSYRYVSRSVYGVEDLDAHGSWVNDPAYGMVWAPRVAVGWAPYQLGRWSWVDYYGWSWVSYDPWGWAPYHYGRWYQGPRGWCWWPGGIGLRHRWSPGLVAWLGFGGGGIGVGFGRVGWVPLAPYEPYHRGYGWNNYRGWGGGGRGFGGNNVTVVNNVNITNIYRNSRVRGGVSGMDSGDFARGRMGQSLRLSDGDLARASLVRGQMPVAPDRNALRLSDRDAVVTPRGGTRADNFYSRRQPAAVERVPFEAQRRGMEEMSRRTFGDRQGREAGVAGRTEAGEGIRGAAADSIRQRRAEGGNAASVTDGNSIIGKGEVQPADRQAGSGRGSVGSGSDEGRGWRRAGEPRGATAGPSTGGETPGAVGAPAETRSSRGSSTGWRRFGEPRGGSSSSGSGATSSGAAERMQQQQQRQRTTPQVGGSGSEGGRNSGDWRRFGDPSGGRSNSPSIDSGSRRRSGGDSGSGGGAGVERQRPSMPDTNRTREAMPQRNEAPRMERERPSMERERPSRERPSMERRQIERPSAPPARPQAESSPPGEPRSFFQRDRGADASGSQRRLEISPPIVRERSSGAGSQRSTRAPQQQNNMSRSSNWDRFGGRSSSGRESASPRMSAPRSDGGAFGSSRRMESFGGGGGGSRSWGSGSRSMGGSSSPRMSAPRSSGGGGARSSSGGGGGGRGGRSR
jgi:hypothetical protein